MPIKTFRGKIADGAQDVVSLHTNTGSTGYKIVKFQIMHTEPGQQSGEHTVKIYRIKQSTIDNAVDFSDQNLLAAGYLTEEKDKAYPVSQIIVFDNVVVNQDIYVTHEDTEGALGCNYYIEMEQMKLSEHESTVATLKDIRNITG